MDIADKIKFLRTEMLKLSKIDFARKLNVSRITIHNWECGISTPTPTHIVLIASLCNVTPDYIIYDDVRYQLNPLGLDNTGYDILKNLIDYFEQRNDYIAKK